jgi:hypothetical protein
MHRVDIHETIIAHFEGDEEGKVYLKYVIYNINI